MHQWILSEEIFDSKERLQEAQTIIKELGDKSEVIYNPWLDWDNIEWEPQSRRICLGTLSTYRNTFDKVDLDPYKVTYYAQFLDINYVNWNFQLFPFWKWSDSYYRNRLFDEYEDTGIFIKPDKGTKNFTGYCPEREKFELDLKSIFLNVKPEDLLIISPKRVLPDYEYRFYIVDNKIVTYSSYSWTKDNYIDVPEDAINYVEKQIPKIKMKDKWDNPITSYTLDIVKVPGIQFYYVVDLNCIYTSGTYNCDLKKLLTALRKEKELSLN